MIGRDYAGFSVCVRLMLLIMSPAHSECPVSPVDRGVCHRHCFYGCFASGSARSPKLVPIVVNIVDLSWTSAPVILTRASAEPSVTSFHFTSC